MDIRVEALSSWVIGNRRVVTVRVLAGEISQTTGVLFMRSESRQDEWITGLATGPFFDPPPEERERQWTQGERVLLFKPFDALRDIEPGEVFTAVQEA